MSTDLAHYRSEFPITEQYNFLSHAASSPLNNRATQAIHEFIGLTQTKPAPKLFPTMVEKTDGFRQRVATFINAQSADEIVPMPNTGTAINSVAASLPLQPGDNVLVLEGDYPSNVYPWQTLAHKGVLTKVVPQHNGGLDVTVLEQRIDKRTRVIAISTVMFATGFRNDIAALGQICKDRGIYFMVDGIQSLGVFPMDVQANNIDFLAAGSHKWMLGAHGAGFLYCRQERMGDLVPGAYVGANSVVDFMNFLDYNLTYPENAARFAVGTPNFAGIVALDASLSLLQEVGVEQISSHVQGLVDALIDDLSERGYSFSASTAPEHRSGIVIAEIPEPLAVCERLEKAGIIATVRGNGVRFAPHFYNTHEEIMQVGEVLDNEK